MKNAGIILNIGFILITLCFGAIITYLGFEGDFIFNIILGIAMCLTGALILILDLLK